jgi:hypothetical protein
MLTCRLIPHVSALPCPSESVHLFLPLTPSSDPQTPARSLEFENESWHGLVQRLYQVR